MYQIILIILLFLVLVSVGIFLKLTLSMVSIIRNKTKKGWILSIIIIVLFSIAVGAIFLANSVSYRSNLEDIFAEIAVKTRIPGICDLIFFGKSYGDYGQPASVSRYFCKAAYGGKIGDVKYCSRLDNFVKYPGTTTQQEFCLRELSENVRDIKICEEFPIDYNTSKYYYVNPNGYKYMCYSAVAERNKDANICLKILVEDYDDGSKKNCLIRVGKRLGSSKVCNFLTGKSAVNECIREIESPVTPDFQ